MDLFACLLAIFLICFHTSNGRESIYNIFYALTLCVFNSFIYLEQSCTNPLKRDGYCVIFDFCPPIMAIVNNPLRRRNDTKFMSDSFCGNDIINGVSKFKVCCDVNGKFENKSISNCHL